MYEAMLNDYVPRWMTPELEALQDIARRFIGSEVTPNQEQYFAAGATDRALWRKAGNLGLLLTDISSDFGGSGGTFAHESVVAHELGLAGDTSWRTGKQIHVIAAHYIQRYGTPDQKQRWLPKMASGDVIGAMGMTEPGGGTDLQNMKTRAVRNGDTYVVEGSKTFITNGSIADIIVLAVKTDPSEKAKGVSLLIFETNIPGFKVGRRLKKIGLHGSDTCELFFDGCQVPNEALLGGVEGKGFYQMMKDLTYERALVGVNSAAVIEHAFRLTRDYAHDRKLFGAALIEQQNTRFVLAEIKTCAMLSRIFCDYVVEKMVSGSVDAELAAMIKWWSSDQQMKVVNQCLQLFGGHGYMLEVPIARMFIDARIEPIYGGSNETMKEIIGRSL